MGFYYKEEEEEQQQKQEEQEKERRRRRIGGGGGGEEEEGGGGGEDEKGEKEEEKKKKTILVGGGGDKYEEVIYGRERDWLQTSLQAGLILHNGTHNNTDLVVVQCHSKSIILYMNRISENTKSCILQCMKNRQLSVKFIEGRSHTTQLNKHRYHVMLIQSRTMQVSKYSFILTVFQIFN